MVGAGGGVRRLDGGMGAMRIMEAAAGRIDHVRCDLCGAVRGMPGADGGVDWGADPRGDVTETAVTVRTGRGAPGGAPWRRRAVHVCPACFTDKLCPWLLAQGAVPTVDAADA